MLYCECLYCRMSQYSHHQDCQEEPDPRPPAAAVLQATSVSSDSPVMEMHRQPAHVWTVHSSQSERGGSSHVAEYASTTLLSPSSSECRCFSEYPDADRSGAQQPAPEPLTMPHTVTGDDEQ